MFTLDLMNYLKETSEEEKNRVSFAEDKGRVKLLQAELNRVGCRAGVVDGIWGRQTYAAAQRFAKNANLSFAGPEGIGESFLQKLEAAKAGHCPALPRRPSRPQPTRPLSAIPWLYQ